MKNAVYYTGLGGGIEPFMHKIFNHFGYDLHQEDLDYYEIWHKDKGKSFMDEEIKRAENCDLIFGISFGGYVAYQVAKATGKKCILINPALDRKRTKTGIYDFDIDTESKEFELNIYIATHDEVVPPKYTTNYIKNNDVKCEVFFVDDMEHGGSYEHIIQIMHHNFTVKEKTE